jgi:two-component system sensor histidine kinase YesM
MKKSYFRRYLIKYMIPLLIPLLILGGFSSVTTQEYMKAEINANNQKMLEQTRNAAETILNDLDPLFYTLNLNARLISDLKLILRSDETGIDASGYTTLMNLINPHANVKSYIHSIYVYFGNDRGKFLASNEGITSIDQFFDTSWHETLARIPEQTNIFIENRSVQRYSFEQQQTNLVTIYRKFAAPGASKSDGTIVLNLKHDMFVKLLDENLYFPEQSIYLRQMDGSIVASSSKKLFEDMAWEWPDPHNTPLLNEVALNGKSYIVSSIGSTRYDMQYLSITPKEYFYQLPIRLAYLTILLLVISFVLGIIGVYFISKRNYRNLVVIMQTIDNGEKGLPVPALPSKITDEYSFILQKTIKRFMEQRYLQVQLSEKKYKLQAMEMTALQSNINPHFMANTLRTIFWKSMSLTGGHNEVSRMIDYLSEIVQYSISDGNKLVTLDEEIFHTNNYVKIMNIRYKDKFDFVFEYDDAMVMEYKVMKLLFQPLIENAVYHGIKESERFGHIRIRLDVDRDRIWIVMVDTGIGMDKERLKQVRSLLRDEEQTEHIGLFNTYKRLQVIYGSSSTFTIRSKYGWGTVIQISIPAIQIE